MATPFSDHQILESIASDADVMHTILDLSAQRKKLNLSLVLNIVVLYTKNTIFNIGVGLYYLAELQVLGLFELIKSDLEKLIKETESVCLIRNRRGGVFATKCCFLADQLDILAERHYNLRAIVDEMTELFKIQSLSMSMVYYLSAMGTIYFTFCSIWYNNTGFDSSLWGFLLIALSIAFLIADNSISPNLGFLIQDQVREINEKLSERTLFSQELDPRLETVFENYKLQLACNPIEYNICGLFKVERDRIIGMINSAIMSSILLVQWELK
ncbi:putative gustatory receptor 59c [Drosophila takahashii]|uniref:putative gustatory receptor 59c n=1 Tax=Drosophila takahashii TaxID=29030 RepID=UPI001CF8BB75|nr:putative gustatory receptor 59c [Drosophila takahashii]